MRRMPFNEFAAIVRAALDSLPTEIAQYLDNVVVDVEEEPDEETLLRAGFSHQEIAEGESLFGLFVPFPISGSEAGDFLDYPHRILIFKRPLEESFPQPQQLRIEIRKTVIHELAHHFGLTDRDLERFDDNPNPFRKKPHNRKK